MSRSLEFTSHFMRHKHHHYHFHERENTGNIDCLKKKKRILKVDLNFRESEGEAQGNLM